MQLWSTTFFDDLAIYEPNERGMPPERTVRHHHRPLVEEADVIIVSTRSWRSGIEAGVMI